jgi:HD-GYP domain-containing protein (c-di-GMP phosphodiesterase class II)
MQFTKLSSVRHRISVGVPLPFHVYDADRTLLLARGQPVESVAQIESLLNRGVLVDLDEILGPVEVAKRAPPAMLPAIWEENIDRIVQTLRNPGAPDFHQAIENACAPLQVLIERDPDLALVQVLLQDGTGRRDYGLHHSMHAAVIGALIARRLNWSDAETARALKGALTMNLAMLELQGLLAQQSGRPDAAQRREILTHPIRSREMLETAGVKDRLWLRAVEEHHEQPDGSGYPSGTRTPCDLASLIYTADVYSAKLSPRTGRDAMSADRAIRKMYMRDPANPFVTALVKETGVYPPGSFVSLASGEAGVVIKRGATITTPIVAVLTNRQRQALVKPLRRDTSQPAHAIVSMLAPRELPTHVRAQTMLVMASD